MDTNYILIISAVYPPEPVVSSRLSSDLYQLLKAKGYLVKVLHPKATRPNGFDFDESIKAGADEIISDSYTCPQSSLIGRIKESFSFGNSCSEYITKHHEEIAMIYANAWPMGSQYRLVKAAKKYGIPVAMHIQDVYPESLTNKMPSLVGGVLRSLILPMDKFILRNSDKVIAISEKMKDYLVKTRGIDERKCSVVINWQDETEFMNYEKSAVHEVHEKFTFMYMGNIGPVAGVDLLIDAFEIAHIDNARLVIAGSGSMKATLQNKAKDNPNIEFWDVPNGKVPEIQAKANVMMLPIKKGAASSSIPSKLPAYMFSAKPIIGSMDQDSDTANAITEAGCGYIVEPENKEQLADMMLKMAEKDRNELAAMGKRGQEYALNHFSKMANLQKLVGIIEEMV